MNELNFEVCTADGCILMKENVILGLYVDDIIVTGKNDEVKKFTDEFQNKFKSRYYESVEDFIGCEFKWNYEESSVILHQTP